MSDNPLTPHEAFLAAFEEMLIEYVDSVLEEVVVSDDQLKQLITAGWYAGRDGALRELQAYEPNAHDVVSCRCWACQACQIMITKLHPPIFGRS